MSFSNKTGTARIGTDWAGVFIGGQDAGSLSDMLGHIERDLSEPKAAYIRRLRDLLGTCREKSRGDIRTKYTLA